MASSPELESFEITDQDLLNEFNPERKTFRMNKHQATYGIWADEDSEDEKPRATKKKQHDYTASLNFVSGGIKIGDKVTKDGGEQEDDSTQSDSDDERPTISMAPTSFGGRPQKRRGFTAVRGQQEGDDIGNWERHTRGIGQKLLFQMGHVKGRGLGKALQGISTPVEAMKRKGKGAVGYHGTERTERSLSDYPVQPTQEEKEDEQFMDDVAQWKRGKGKKEKKVKYTYQTADELIATGTGRKMTKKEKQSELAKVKVIDMTRKEQRILSGYDALAHKHDRPEDDEPVTKSRAPERSAFDMPELVHNLDLLVDMAEDAIIHNDRKARYEEDLAVNLNHEKEKLDAVCDQEERQINTLKQILELIEQCEKRLDPKCPDPLSLEECAKFFKTLMDDYYEEYKLYELSSLAIALVFPLMKNHFVSWEPLRSPRHGLPVLREWKGVLEGMGQPLLHDQGYMDPYDRLVWEIWMPHIRPIISTKWVVRSPDLLLEVIEAWIPMLPNWILSNLLEQLVFPRLQAEVESWDPLTDTMPIHAWLHPWLPLMGDRLEPLFGPIRHKLANALTNWHPSDNSAKLILQPWHKVFNSGHMDAFLLKNIVPKLSLCMSEFLINPHEQHLDGWQWVMAWLDLLPRQYIVTILDKHFFIKWLKVLTAWLTSAPNYDEVTKWYRGWKSMFPDVLLADPTIKEKFSEALNLMNRAVTGQGQQPGARENVAYLASTERRRDYETKAAYERREQDGIRGLTASSSVPTSFRDLVERRAEEYGIMFVPLVGKFREAKQIYKFGELHIYFDRNVLFSMEPATQKWVPMSLNTLIDRAKQS